MKKLEYDINGIKTILHYKSNKFIVCCHGLYSNKESKKYLEMVTLANREGYSCIRFDFRGCGESKGKFNESKLSNRVKDLGEVINFFSNKFKNAEFALFGSSFGGMVSIIYASINPIKCLAIISTPYEIKGRETKFVDLDVLKAAENVSKILIIHGLKDELVDYKQAKTLYEVVKEPKKILFFDADHSFSNKEVRIKALKESIYWIKSYL